MVHVLRAWTLRDRVLGELHPWCRTEPALRDAYHEIALLPGCERDCPSARSCRLVRGFRDGFRLAEFLRRCRGESATHSGSESFLDLVLVLTDQADSPC